MVTILNQIPLNISLLILDAKALENAREIKVLDIFESIGSKNFHPDGLFSIDIFGKVGDERRNRVYGYIDLHLDIMHPIIFNAVVELKELYGKIMAGTAYAVFNPETKDFDAATSVTGQTGYSFFLKHFQDLVFEERKATSREFNIKLIDKYRKTAMINKLVVMPAGLRDFIITPNGKPEEDEINTFYRRIISIASVVGRHSGQNDQSYLDSIRYNLQLAVCQLNRYILDLLEGKHKLIQGWWASRKIFRSTRNVITSNVPKTTKLFDEFTIGPNDTVAGLYQILMAIFPITVHLTKDILSSVFPGPNSPARLVNKKTLLSETASVDLAHYDDWMTHDGLEQTIGRFETESLRHEAIEIEGKYLALTYNDGKVVKICHGADDLPETLDKKYLSPTTYAELFYLAVFKRVREIPFFLTRYPITGFGSVYPCFVYLKTTTRSQSLRVLNDNWEPSDEIANEFPIKGIPFINSMSPSITKLKRLGADFDGDVCSLTPVMSDEGIEEINALLNNKNFYVGIDNKINFSSANDVSNLVFAEMTN